VTGALADATPPPLGPLCTLPAVPRATGDLRTLVIVGGISGFLVSVVTSDLPLWLALVASIAIGAVVGLAVGLVIWARRRRRRDQPQAEPSRGANGGANPPGAPTDGWG
jgi:hypothetical protein